MVKKNVIEQNNKRNITLDILKVISAYMVIFIHCKFYGKFGMLIEAIARFAVPLFFCISGYFSYGDSDTKLKKKAFKIFKMYLMGFFIYFIFNVLYSLLKDGVRGFFEYISSLFGISDIFKFLTFNVSKVGGHLWFLLALVYSYTIQCFVKKMQVNEKSIFIITCILLLIYFFIGTFLPFFKIEIPIFYIRNFLFLGYPFFYLGYFIKKNEEKILKRFNNKLLFSLIIFGVVEVIIAALLLGKKELYMGTIFIVFPMIVYSMKLKNKNYSNEIVRLSQCSTYIYIFHILIADVMYIIQGKILFIPYDAVFINLLPIIVCIFSTLLSLILLKFKEINLLKK